VPASTGDSVGSGFTISSFNGETSINDNGRVAFVAVGGGPSTGRMVVAADTPTPARIISFNPSTRLYDFAQITNDNQVVVGDRITTGGTPFLFIRTWDSNNPGISTTLVRHTDKDDTNTPLDIVQIPSRANNGNVSFLSFPGGASTLTYRSTAGAIKSLGAISGAFRSMTGDNGWTVIRNSPASGQAILAFPATGTGQSIATPANFSAVGLPGISDDGTIIAFAGNNTTDGKGIYLSHLDAGTWSTPIKVAGIANELGYDTAGNGLFLNDFDMSISSRVGVVRQEAASPASRATRFSSPLSARPMPPVATIHRLPVSRCFSPPIRGYGPCESSPASRSAERARFYSIAGPARSRSCRSAIKWPVRMLPRSQLTIPSRPRPRTRTASRERWRQGITTWFSAPPPPLATRSSAPPSSILIRMDFLITGNARRARAPPGSTSIGTAFPTSTSMPWAR
jgi:hypothetical protein